MLKSPYERCGSLGRPAFRCCGDRQSASARQAPGHVGSETIRRHNVEADRGHQHDATTARVVVPSADELDRRELRRNVEIVRTGAETCIRDRLRCPREGSCGVQHHGNAGERVIEPIRIRRRRDATV